MPQQTAHGIDVSREEERYLRRAFRRFALPYVLIFGAVAWVATTAVSSDDPTASPEDLSALRAEVAALKASLAALDGRIDQVGNDTAKAARRVRTLESQSASGDAAVDTSALARDLRDAGRRVAALEARVSDGAPADERIDALAARVRRLEESAQAASAPEPAAPTPAAPVPVR